MKKQIIYAMGDIHADFGQLNTFINKKIRCNRKIQELAQNYELEFIILQCGDFAFFWPNYDHSKAIKNRVDFLQDGHVKIYWCDGNHDDHDALDALETAHPDTPFIEVAPQVYFATFGSVLTLLDGTKVLFAGGGDCEYDDKKKRISKERLRGRKTWWKQEGIDEKDMQNLPYTHIDWIISHASPVNIWPFFDFRARHRNEPSQEYLAEIQKRYKPTNWFHGHYHSYKEYEHDGCNFTSLNCVQYRNSWHKIIAHITQENGDQVKRENIMQKLFVFSYIDEEYKLCGTLQFQKDGRFSSFEYFAKYVSHASAISVDPFHLPLPKVGKSTEYTKKGMYFEDFLAGSFEQQTCEKLGITCDIKDMLIRNRQGFLRFCESKTLAAPVHEYVTDWQAHWQKIKALRAADNFSDVERQELAESFPLFSLGGMRPKTLYEDAEGKLWMVKFADKHDTFDVPLMEYACAKLIHEFNVGGTAPNNSKYAKEAMRGDLHIAMKDTSRIKLYDRDAVSVPKMFVETHDGERVLFVEMFDKNPKQLFISGLTVMGVAENDYKNFSYQSMFTNAQKLHPDFFGEELFRRIAFNIFINNTDDHPRNHGFLYDGKNLSLAPCYDLVPTPRIEGLGSESYLACSFGPEGRLATFENLYAACESFGITEETAWHILASLKNICHPQQERCYGLDPATNGWRDMDIPKEQEEHMAYTFDTSLKSLSVAVDEIFSGKYNEVESHNLFYVRRSLEEKEEEKLRVLWEQDLLHLIWKQGYSELTLAATLGLLDHIRDFAKAGADIDEQDAKKRTALSCAQRHGHTATVDFLLRHGAKNVDLQNLMENAVSNGDVETVKILHKQGAELHGTKVYEQEFSLGLKDGTNQATCKAR